MESKKKELIKWIKNHKKQLIFAGISITTLVCIILGIKNKDTLAELWISLAESVKKAPATTTTSIPAVSAPVTVSEAALPIRPYTSPTASFNVSSHVRTMPIGRHHSAAKALEAAGLGIYLLPNQTLVDAYTKCGA